MKKYIIHAPSYDPNSGGCIVLHKLCSELNDLGYDAYIFPRGIVKSRKNKKISLRRKIKHFFETKNFNLNERFNTKLFKGGVSSIDDEYIVVYSEIVDGNPLNAKHVVRWLLHKPGYHTGRIHFGLKELYFRYLTGLVSDFELTGSTTSNLFLTISDFPLDLYYQKNSNYIRSGTAYLMRKGREKEIIHDLNDSIKIDGLSHAEIAKVFKKVKRFISYDEYSAYSRFAVLSGCESIVVPDGGKTKEEWRPDPDRRLGIKYGLDDELDYDLERDKELLRNSFLEKSKENKENVEKFVKESQAFFSKDCDFRI